MPEMQKLTCPNCSPYGRGQVLGALLPDGSLTILRHGHGTTRITATTYVLSCGCGYTFHVSEGAITTRYMAS